MVIVCGQSRVTRKDHRLLTQGSPTICHATFCHATICHATISQHDNLSRQNIRKRQFITTKIFVNDILSPLKKGVALDNFSR